MELSFLKAFATIATNGLERACVLMPSSQVSDHVHGQAAHQTVGHGATGDPEQVMLLLSSVQESTQRSNLTVKMTVINTLSGSPGESGSMSFASRIILPGSEPRLPICAAN